MTILNSQAKKTKPISQKMTIQNFECGLNALHHALL